MKKLSMNVKDKITWKRVIWCFLCAISILGALILHTSRTHMVSKLEDQTVASRWSEENNWAQISCFFSNKEDIQVDRILQIRYLIEQKIMESSIEVTSENPSARLFVDCYSANGEISVAYEEQIFSGDAYGVGGDFFLFHPLDIIYGNYFSEADLMDDYVIIDEEIAWELFGSSNVVGKYITIQNVSHKIVGVYDRADDSMNEKAGNEKPTIYVSYHSLENYGMSRGIKVYEIMLPNPVSEFAKKMVDTVLGMDEHEVSIVENSTRYQSSSLLKIFHSFPARSMSVHGIGFPFWENVARGYEDIAVCMLKYEIVCFILPFATLIYFCVLIRNILKRKMIEKRDRKKHKII